MLSAFVRIYPKLVFLLNVPTHPTRINKKNGTDLLQKSSNPIFLSSKKNFGNPIYPNDLSPVKKVFPKTMLVQQKETNRPVISIYMPLQIPQHNVFPFYPKSKHCHQLAAHGTFRSLKTVEPIFVKSYPLLYVLSLYFSNFPHLWLSQKKFSQNKTYNPDYSSDNRKKHVFPTPTVLRIFSSFLRYGKSYIRQTELRKLWTQPK